MQRKWTVPPHMPADPHQALQIFDEEDGRQQALAALAEAEAIAHNLGGVIFLTARRVKVGPDPDDYATAGYVVVWESFQRAERDDTPTTPPVVVEDGEWDADTEADVRGGLPLGEPVESG